MNETATLTLPLLQPSQAQKHVTVNEALVRLDGLTQITLQSIDIANPPSAPADGDCYAVASGASGDWTGEDGKLAIFSNGGWIFVAPRSGWSAWIVDRHCRATFLPDGWQVAGIASSPNGARASFEIFQSEHVVIAGGDQDTGLSVPSDTLVFACSARLLDPLAGSATGWTLDLNDGSITFGTGMGLGAGSYCTGLLSQPTAVYSDTAVRLRPEGGSFDAGARMALALHGYRLAVPASG